MDDSPQPAVHIHRSPTFPFRRSKAARLLSYFSFFTTATLIGLTTFKRFDVVITLTTPPLLSLMGTVLKQLRKTRHFIWEMDVYPEIAVDLGMLQADSLLAKTIGALADVSRSRSDGVMVLGSCMRERLLERGIDDDKIYIAENWSDGRDIEPTPFHVDGRVRVLYSGNLGLAHDVDTIYEAMLALRGDVHFDFIFAGGGARREALEEKCVAQDLRNVSFRPYCRRADLGRSLADGDIGLVTQKASCAGSVVPSKVYGLMAAGRPVLYIGPRHATPARMIEEHRCGWQVDVGDSRGLVDLLQLLYGDPEMIRDAGRRARQAFLEKYDLAAGVSRICGIVGASHAARVPQSDEQPAPSAFHA